MDKCFSELDTCIADSHFWKCRLYFRIDALGNTINLLDCAFDCQDSNTELVSKIPNQCSYKFPLSMYYGEDDEKNLTHDILLKWLISAGIL